MKQRININWIQSGSQSWRSNSTYSNSWRTGQSWGYSPDNFKAWSMSWSVQWSGSMFGTARVWGETSKAQ